MPEHCDSKQIKNVADNLMLLYNAKLKKERSEDKNIKKKAAVLKGVGKGYDRNNNAAMINDVMGAAEEDDEVFGEPAAFKKAEEADYDFM
jgi:hypothetical protein